MPEADPRRRQLRHRALLAVLVTGIAVWLFVQVTEDDEVGRTLDATAVVASGCQWLDVRSDGFFFQAASGLPIEWRGQTIQGTVEITEDHGADDLAGIFTGSDGRTTRVHGWEEGGGEKFTTLGCGIWPE